jgi:hypothetical protein
MKTPNKKSAAKSTDANKNSSSKTAIPKPPLGFTANEDDEDFDLSLNDDLDLDNLDSLDDDEDDY